MFSRIWSAKLGIFIVALITGVLGVVLRDVRGVVFMALKIYGVIILTEVSVIGAFWALLEFFKLIRRLINEVGKKISQSSFDDFT